MKAKIFGYGEDAMTYAFLRGSQQKKATRMLRQWLAKNAKQHSTAESSSNEISLQRIQAPIFRASFGRGSKGSSGEQDFIFMTPGKGEKVWVVLGESKWRQGGKDLVIEGKQLRRNAILEALIKAFAGKRKWHCAKQWASCAEAVANLKVEEFPQIPDVKRWLRNVDAIKKNKGVILKDNILSFLSLLPHAAKIEVFHLFLVFGTEDHEYFEIKGAKGRNVPSESIGKWFDQRKKVKD
jgi:hypothetical protein